MRKRKKGWREEGEGEVQERGMGRREEDLRSEEGGRKAGGRDGGWRDEEGDRKAGEVRRRKAGGEEEERGRLEGWKG